jgi:hypothetical protein
MESHMKLSKAKKPKDTPEKQHARFVEAARKAEADESPDALDKAFERVDLIKPSAPRSRPSSKRVSS